jgi:DNA repair protein RecO (recombination protein O)
VRVADQPAFVLHQRPYRETSALLELVTRDHGRVGVVARGVRATRPRWPRGLLSVFVPLIVGYAGRGELATLTALEAAGRPSTPHPDALASGLYANELLVRLLPRNDPHPGIFERYADLLGALALGTSLAWELRRFERDLLIELGFGLPLEIEADGATPVYPEADYSFDPERGPVPWAERPAAPRVTGAALLALAADTPPDAAGAVQLRRLMRAVLLHHLGGRPLASWSTFRATAGRE